MKTRTPVAYLSVAGICLILNIVILIAADGLGMPLYLGIFLSFMAVVSTGYVLHAIFTFRQALTPSGFIRYAIAMSANIPLAFATTWFWQVAIGLPMHFAAPIASGFLLALNFVLGRWAISAPIAAKANMR